VPACAQALCETAIILSLALLPFLLLSVARTYTEAIRGADGGLRGRPPLHRRERRAAGRQLTSPTAGKEERSSHPARLARSGARQPARGTGLGDRNRRSRNRHVTMVGAGGGREGELRADPWLEGRAGRERAQGRIARTVLGPFFSALYNRVRGSSVSSSPTPTDKVSACWLHASATVLLNTKVESCCNLAATGAVQSRTRPDSPPN
jgi:hypothetical protein